MPDRIRTDSPQQPDPAVAANPRPGLVAWIALVCVSAGNLLTAMSNAGTNLSLPAVAHEYPATAVQLSWVPTIFVLTNTILILPFGRLADRLGLKRVYVTGTLIFGSACGLAVLATGFNWIIFCRFLQACGSAMMQACGMAIVMQLFPAARRGTAIGIGASCLYLGLSLGPPIGGWVTDTLGWRATFMLPLPFATAVVGLILWGLQQEWQSRDPLHFDWIGLVLLAVSLVLLVTGVSSLPSSTGFLMAGAGVATGGFFVLSQFRIEHPLLRLRAIVGNHMFSRAAMLQLLMYAASYPLMYLAGLYLQYIKGLSASQAGTALLVQAALMAMVAPLSGRMADRASPRLIATAGSGAAALGYFGLCWVGYNTPLWWVYGSLALVGAGMGMFSSPNFKLAMGSIPDARLAAGTAVMNSARSLGNIFGMVAVLTLVALIVGNEPIAPHSYDQFLVSVKGAFAFSCISALIALSVSLRQLHREPD